mmetsp:Transcript_55696/g.144833  ORF Transcript_55696/g.144833 Transcript_55696/m.144833 type:complete len:105 (+) Transcript_55696:99-413(+)
MPLAARDLLQAAFGGDQHAVSDPGAAHSHDVPSLTAFYPTASLAKPKRFLHEAFLTTPNLSMRTAFLKINGSCEDGQYQSEKDCPQGTLARCKWQPNGCKPQDS